MEVKGIQQKLCVIQNEMKVPKNLYNSFGKYNYRNAETILETAKPICLKHQATLICYDTIVQIGDRYYVKAVVELHDWETGEVIENQAFAREEFEKKGMDASQVTGATSSYARKYALNGLFLLDDTKDADADEYRMQSEKAPKKASKKRIETVLSKIQQKEFMSHANNTISTLHDLGIQKASQLNGITEDNIAKIENAILLDTSEIENNNLTDLEKAGIY